MDNLNTKLSTFLDSFKTLKISKSEQNDKIQKTATLGNFTDIKDTNEIAKVAKMTNEMLALPKYQPIMSKLSGSTGIVNFVTHNEYQPLIELMLKKVFPSSSNDIFNMGQQEASGEDYFVSPEFFAKNIIQGNPQHVVKSRQRLEDLLLGSKAKITRQWLKEIKHFSEEEIQAMLGSPNQDAAIAQAMEAQARGGQAPQINQLGVAVTMYERRMTEIKEKYDGPISQLNKEILEHNLGDRVMKPEDLAKKKEQRDIWVGLKISEMDHVNSTIGENIVVEKWYPGKSERNSDGFISFSPPDEVVAASIELAKKVAAGHPEQEVLRSVMNLKVKLEDYHTSNPKLKQIKERFMAFLGNGTHEDYSRIVSNISGMYMQLQHAFASSIKKQGKVLILDDFDKSALCSTSDARGGALKLDDVSASVFQDFVGKNSSNLERDDSQGKRDRGNRAIVVLSSEKIANLPSSTIIEMDIAPVDIEEAEIIVRNILAQYSKDALLNLKRRLHREIDEKYGDKPSPKKGFEKETITEQVEAQAGTLGNISDETKKRMIGMVIGLSQRDAINAIRMAIQSGIKKEADEDVLSPNMAFEEKDIVKNLRDTVNTKLSSDVMGLTVVEPEVAFEDYAYNRTSEWANRVISIKDVRDEMVDLKECIKLNEKRIAEIDRDIRVAQKLPQGSKGKLDASDIKILMAERQGLINQTAHYKVDINSIASNDLPHVYVLYGAPGVGKCLGRGTPVMMFDGNIKNVEEVVKGDLLMGPDSKPRTVLTTTCGVGPLYRVEQQNGDDYVCNDAHLLSLQSTDKPSDQQPIFISAEDFYKKKGPTKYRNKGWKAGVEFEEKSIPVDPYWLGLWLGDGDSRRTSITVGNKDEGELSQWLTQWSEDNHLFLRKDIASGAKCWNFACGQGKDHGVPEHPIKTKLKNLNLLQNKHIPEVYLKNSSKNRLLLLAGLIDSDGYKTKTGSVQFTNVNKRLATEVLYLCRSLGFRTTFTEGIKRITKINYSVMAYTVTIGGTLSRIPSKLSRKQGHDNPQKKSLRYAIDVKPIGDGEYFGFTVDGDSQFLLGDFTVTHNSIWAHALASLLKLNIRSVDIGAQKDMWLGNTEKNCIRLFNTMKESRDTIYLIDEIDRQVEMGSSQGPSTHETTKEIVSRFLDLFDNTENERKFRQNNVFFIMTTNNVEEIDTALLQRVSETYEVQLPDRPEDYEKFFRSYLNVERGRFPDDPWFCDEDDKTNEECWTSTMEMLNSMDWKRISVVFAQKRIDFRSLKKMLQQAFNEHRSWRIRSRMIGKGKVIEPRGMPLTTQNLIDVGNIISTAADSNDSFKLGVGQLASEKSEQVRKMLEPYASGQKKLETMEVKDPHTGKVETRFKLPDDVMKVMTGEAQEQQARELPQGEWEYKREIDPSTGQVKTELKPKVDPLKEMQELQDTGFKEEPLIDKPQEKQPPAKEKGKETKKDKDMKKKEEAITSSTDYFFDYLGKKGLVNDNKFEVPAKEAKEVKEAKVEKEIVVSQVNQNVPQEDSGVYNFGFIMVAPGAAKVPSQQIKTELNKGTNKRKKV